jgi:hypothetical protein
MFVDSLRVHGPPGTLYLDNGSTYRGEILQTVCARLGIALVHAKPYDPQARGKMERFWRTLREGCLDHISRVNSLSDLNERLRAWLEKRYHQAPHGGLLGKSPAKAYAARSTERTAIDEATLKTALTIRNRRRVSADNVLSIDGVAWELDQGFLAGQLVVVASCFLIPGEPPWVEHEGKRLSLHLLDPIKNARRKRAQLPPSPAHGPRRSVDFDPTRSLVTKRLHADADDPNDHGGNQ